MIFQGFSGDVLGVFKMFQWHSRVIQGFLQLYRGVPGDFRSVTEMFQEISDGSDNVQGRFKRVLC